MAKIRIGFSTHFEIENELAGIGTDNPTNTKQVLGNIKSSDAKVTGITTLTTYQGFVDSKARIEASVGAKQHTTSSEIIIEGEVTVSSGTTFTSGPENLTVTDSLTLPGISGDKPSVGTTRFNENFGSLEFYTGSEWRVVNSRIDKGNSGRGVFMTGITTPAGNLTSTIDYIQIPTLGDAIDFGEVLDSGECPAACSSEVRGVLMGGETPAYDAAMEYITIASKGNAINFGNNSSGRGGGNNACSSSTRGINGGGRNPGPTALNILDYIEIATLGDAIDFGDLVYAATWISSFSSPTRGFWAGGGPSYGHKGISMVTIASKGNATDFGDLSAERPGSNGTSNSVRALVTAGYKGDVLRKDLDTITMASAGNAVVFAEATVDMNVPTAAATQTRGVYGGGMSGGDTNRLLEYVTWSSLGNPVFFGDLTKARGAAGGCSDSHGGLGGF